jgi:hypothetical protein
MAPKTPKPKGSAELCNALKEVINANLDIAEDQKNSGDMKGAAQSIDIASEGLKTTGSGAGSGSRRECTSESRLCGSRLRVQRPAAASGARLRAKKGSRSPARSRR